MRAPGIRASDGFPSRVVNLFAALSLLVSSGCAADAQSRQLAAQLRKLTAQYNAAAAAKIEAEQAFYTASQKNLENTLNVVDPTTKAPNVKNTLAYGRIVTTTNAASLSLAGDLIDGAGSARTATKVTAFIQEGVLFETQAFTDARNEENQAAKAIATDFNTLQQYQGTLSTLTEQLSELEKPTPFATRASELEAFGQATIQQLKSQTSQKK